MKKLVISLALCTVLLSPNMKVEASEQNLLISSDANMEENEIVLYADSIIYKYRVANNRLQYRRWNETRNYWVDSEWIDV